MNKRQEYSPEDIARFQEELLSVAEPWVAEHKDKTNGRITFSPHDPINKPWQRVDEFITSARPLPKLPEQLTIQLIRFKLAQSMGRSALADTRFSGYGVDSVVMGIVPATKFVNQFQNTPAFLRETEGPTVSERLIDNVAQGKNTMLAFAHQDYSDIAKGLGAATIAAGRPSLIEENNFTLLSPVMKYEDYRGEPIPSRVSKAGRVVYVPPNTTNGRTRFSREFFSFVGRGSTDVYGRILDDPNTGTISAVALAGGAMIPIKDELGNVVGWDFPESEKSMAVPLAKFNEIIPVSFYIDPQTRKTYSKVHHVISAPSADGLKGQDKTERNELLFDQTMLSLQTGMEDIAQLPIGYKKLRITRTLGFSALSPSAQI